jgi:hypothetical protein
MCTRLTDRTAMAHMVVVRLWPSNWCTRFITSTWYWAMTGPGWYANLQVGTRRCQRERVSGQGGHEGGREVDRVQILGQLRAVACMPC